MQPVQISTSDERLCETQEVTTIHLRMFVVTIQDALPSLQTDAIIPRKLIGSDVEASVRSFHLRAPVLNPPAKRQASGPTE